MSWDGDIILFNKSVLLNNNNQKKKKKNPIGKQIHKFLSNEIKNKKFIYHVIILSMTIFLDFEKKKKISVIVYKFEFIFLVVIN